MSLKIRLSRSGKKHHHSYRLVVAETRSKRDGKPVEILGKFNPSEKQTKPVIDMAKLSYWQEKGAILTPSAKKIIEK